MAYNMFERAKEYIKTVIICPTRKPADTKQKMLEITS